MGRPGGRRRARGRGRARRAPAPHAILRNFPLLGHARYALEELGPELRQYVVASNNEERPFSRDQRRWVYASSKGQPNTFGFGTDDEMDVVAGLTCSSRPPFRSRLRVSTSRAPPRSTSSRPRRSSAAPPAAARVPPGVGGEHLRDELRLPVAAGGGGAQPRGGAGAVPAEHGRGRAGARPTATAASSSSRSGRATSAAAGRTGPSPSSACASGSTEAPVRALEIKLSQGAKPGSAGCCRERRSRRRSRGSAGCARAWTA
jgi:glutamate synthase domain-containing protein 2